MNPQEHCLKSSLQEETYCSSPPHGQLGQRKASLACGGSRLPTPHSSPSQGEGLALFLRTPRPASLSPPRGISPGSSPENISQGLNSEARTVTFVPLGQGQAHLHVFRPVTAVASFRTAILPVICFAVSSLPALRIRPTPQEAELMVVDLESSHSFLLMPQQGRCQQEASGPAALRIHRATASSLAEAP